MMKFEKIGLGVLGVEVEVDIRDWAQIKVISTGWVSDCGADWFSSKSLDLSAFVSVDLTK